MIPVFEVGLIVGEVAHGFGNVTTSLDWDVGETLGGRMDGKMVDGGRCPPSFYRVSTVVCPTRIGLQLTVRRLRRSCQGREKAVMGSGFTSVSSFRLRPAVDASSQCILKRLLQGGRCWVGIAVGKVYLQS